MNKSKLLIFFKAPINQCAIFLGFLALAASYVRLTGKNNNYLEILLELLLASIFIIFIPWMLSYLKIKTFRTVDSVISFFIFFLVVDPKQGFLITLAMVALVIFSRIYIRYKGLPIFNPVVFGISILALINIFIDLKISPSWWGVSFNPRFTDIGFSITTFFILPIGLYLAYKFKKLPLVLASFVFSSIFFLIVEILINQYTFADTVSVYYAVFLEGTIFFAFLFMLDEPKTTPVKFIPQIIYAFVFSLAWMTLYYYQFNGSIIMAMCVANLITFSTRYLDFQKMRKKINTSKPQNIAAV